MTLCDSCCKAKAHVWPFHSSFSSTSPCTLWCLGSRPDSSNGNRYYVHFTDGCSRFSWREITANGWRIFIQTSCSSLSWNRASNIVPVHTATKWACRTASPRTWTCSHGSCFNSRASATGMMFFKASFFSSIVFPLPRRLFFLPLPSFLVKTRIIASCALLDVFATHFSDHITITSSSVLCRERAPVPLLYEDMDPPFLLATTSCFTLLIEMYLTSAVSPGTDVIPLAA